MNNKLLLLLLVLLSTATLSNAAVVRTLQINFDYFPPDIPDQDLLGFRLYKEGQLVCETSVPSESSITCDIESEDGTFNFALAGVYSNDIESSHSPSYPFTITSDLATSSAEQITSTPLDTIRNKKITYSWANDSAVADLAGYRMYMNDTFLCETEELHLTSFSCTVDLVNSPMAFTITSVNSNGVESQKSNILLLDPSGLADIAPESEALVAVISPTVASGEVPFGVSFIGANSTGDIASYSWDFGDGSVATGAVVNHIYSSSGTYDATLMIEDKDGSTEQVSTTITALQSSVVSQPPTAIISSSTAVGNGLLIVDFDGSLSTTTNLPIVSYNWTFGDGSEATGEMISHSFTTAGTYLTTLTVVDSEGLWGSSSTPVIVTESSTESDLPKIVSTSGDDSILISDNNLNIEIGTVSINHEWGKVYFEKNFINPIVVASSPTVNEPQPALVRIRNVDQEGFEIHIEEWDYLDGLHPFETVSYVVIEEGTYLLGNEMKIEAGKFSGSTSSEDILLQQTYGAIPVILTQVVTANEPDAVTSRVEGISQRSFKHMLQEQEITSKEHKAESINYIACEPGQGELPGIQYEIGTIVDSVTHDWFDINSQMDFSGQPFLFTGMLTNNDGDTAVLRHQTISQIVTQVKIEEEQSFDTEVTHDTEALGYFIFSQFFQAKA